ncbi:MAG: hypothetical protein M1324_01835 [Patescibacteria group bacterium]|nr:hypothetical protein [Patescibacteria group bacterium]
MRNRDAKKVPKRAERQREIAGKFPFHRVAKFKHMIKKLLSWRNKT